MRIANLFTDEWDDEQEHGASGFKIASLEKWMPRRRQTVRRRHPRSDSLVAR